MKHPIWMGTSFLIAAQMMVLSAPLAFANSSLTSPRGEADDQRNLKESLKSTEQEARKELEAPFELGALSDDLIDMMPPEMMGSDLTSQPQWEISSRTNRSPAVEDRPTAYPTGINSRIYEDALPSEAE